MRGHVTRLHTRAPVAAPLQQLAHAPHAVCENRPARLDDIIVRARLAADLKVDAGEDLVRRQQLNDLGILGVVVRNMLHDELVNVLQ